MSKRTTRVESSEQEYAPQSESEHSQEEEFENKNVDELKKDPKLRKLFTEEEIEGYKGLFDMFDIDGGGTISQEELMQIMK